MVTRAYVENLSEINRRDQWWSQRRESEQLIWSTRERWRTSQKEEAERNKNNPFAGGLKSADIEVIGQLFNKVWEHYTSQWAPEKKEHSQIMLVAGGLIAISSPLLVGCTKIIFGEIGSKTPNLGAILLLGSMTSLSVALPAATFAWSLYQFAQSPDKTPSQEAPMPLPQANLLTDVETPSEATPAPLLNETPQ